MSATLWKYAGLLVFLCFVFIGGTRLLPVAEPDLSAFNSLFLTSDTCPESDCLLGIRSNTTSLDDALGYLRHHRWIGSIHLDQDMSQANVHVSWEWSGQQPDIIDSQISGSLNAHYYRGPAQYRVTSISLATTLRFEDLRTLLSDAGSIAWRRSNALSYNLSYQDDPQTHTTVTMQLSCPLRPLYYWNASARVTQGSGPLHMLADNYTPLREAMRLC